MSVVFMEGFDLYNGLNTNTGLGSRWVQVAGGSGLSGMITGRFSGGQAFRTSGTNSAGTTVWRSGLDGTYTASTVCFAFRISDLSSSRVDFLWLALDGNVQIGLSVTTLGDIRVYRGASSWVGATQIAASAGGVIFQNTWHFIEVASTINGSTGTLTVKVDGDTVIGPLTGLNTQAQASAGFNYLYLGATTIRTVDFDDMYIENSTTFRGERRIETLRPNGDTATKQWLPNSGATNYTQVDETTADGDTTYVQSTNVGDTDLYEMTDLSTTPTTIDAVRPVVCAKKTDSTTRTIKASGSSGGTSQDGSEVFLAADYNFFGPDIYALDWHDSAAWTKTKVDALKIGPKVAS